MSLFELVGRECPSTKLSVQLLAALAQGRHLPGIVVVVHQRGVDLNQRAVELVGYRPGGVTVLEYHLGNLEDGDTASGQTGLASDYIIYTDSLDYG